MMYFTKISEGEKKCDVIFKTENYNFAKQAADNYKRDTNVNCHIESVSTVYTTSTLEEALNEANGERRAWPAMTASASHGSPEESQPYIFPASASHGPR